MDFGIASVAVITVIAFLIGMIFKNLTKLDNKWVPVICGIVGGVLGIAGMNIIPDFPAQDIISAAAVGIVSGLAATGVHQIGKQLGDGEVSENA